jgi:hypothetical protein
MSIRDISAILKDEEARRQKDKERQQQEELSSKAYNLFCKKITVEVAIELNLREGGNRNVQRILETKGAT